MFEAIRTLFGWGKPTYIPRVYSDEEIKDWFFSLPELEVLPASPEYMTGDYMNNQFPGWQMLSTALFVRYRIRTELCQRLYTEYYEEQRRLRNLRLETENVGETSSDPCGPESQG